VLSVRGEYTVKARQINSGLGLQCGQLGNEIHRRTTLLNRQKAVDGEYVFPGRYSGHKTIQNNRALEAAFKRTGLTDVSSHNMRKTFASRLLSRGAAITDVQHLLGHASVKTTEKAYAAFVKNERFKQTIDLLDTPVLSKLKIVK